MGYSEEVNVQILISLLKQYKIRKIVASPGATNISFVGSIQSDSFFEIYSSVDERSAAYIACGLSEESGEPVALSCTGATASRNYMPGLTEAYYRKLPVLAITSTQIVSRIGSHIPQVIDRTVLPNDIAKLSVTLPVVKDESDRNECILKINKALSELFRKGGGPVHINLPTIYSHDFSVSVLPEVRKIARFDYDSTFPKLDKSVAIFVGSHSKFSSELTNVIEKFCEENNSVVFCDHTSNYNGRYKVIFPLVQTQDSFISELNKFDIMIHIGEISGAYAIPLVKEVWRVNIDGEYRDTFGKLKYVFETSELFFFKSYINNTGNKDISRYKDCLEEYKRIYEKINFEELPFSNIWVANVLSKELPKKSVLHLGILNTLRSWNFFNINGNINSYCNVGGFGIDGNLSSLIGASLYDRAKLYFGIFGDLSFFYDMNSLGNRHIGNNLRVLVINNGLGTEFKNYSHTGAIFGNETDKYIAAGGHYGSKSKELIKNYAENLGFQYLSASNKVEFLSLYKTFITETFVDKPILFEVFTNSIDESNALEYIRSIEKDNKVILKAKAKEILGNKLTSIVRKVIK